MKAISLFLLLLGFLFIYSCSSAQKAAGGENLFTSGRKDSMVTMEIKGKISSSIQGNDNTGICKINISRMDSVSLSVFGPMGVVVGRLFATPDYFVFFNAMSNEALEGSPNSENLKKVLNMPLSYNEFVRLVRNETPDNPTQFVFDTTMGEKKLYKNFSQKQYIEYVLVADDGTTVQYQRKLRDGTLILNVFYTNYNSFNGFNLARKLTFEFPQLQGRITLSVDDYKINEPVEKSYSFPIPKSIKKYKLD